MKKLNFIFILTVFITTIIPTAAKCAHSKKVHFDSLIDEADVIAVVEILSTDYTATAGDGPMYAEAKVLKVLKGNISMKLKLRFGETAWWSPTYKKGERRIVFLRRKTSKDKYYKARWRTIYTERTDFFFAEDSLKSISRESLLDFLKELQEQISTMPTIEFSVIHKDAIKMLSVKVINDGERAFYLNPSRVMVNFEANRVRYHREINWANYEENTWIKIEPTSSIAGFIYIKTEEVKEENEIKVVINHFSACFPYHCWVGFNSANVNLEK